MPNIDKIGNYKESDVMLIGAIVVGFAKLVSRIVNKPAKTHYESHSHQETSSSSTHTYFGVCRICSETNLVYVL